VTIGDDGDALVAAFQEASGLNSETQVIEYRHGASTQFSTIKMPGIQKFGNVTLKQGIFKGETSFWTWYGSMSQNTIKRQTIVIELLDESDAPQMKWTLTNAWPTKISGTDLKTEGSEVAVHTLELAFEKLEIANT
jgi:phage tail-like protein